MPSNSASQPAPRAPHPWLAANLVAQLAFGLLTMTVCLPSMQDWPATFQASQAAVQLTFSGFVAAYGGLQLLHGPLSDRLGRKPVLMAGLAVSCVGAVMAILAPNLAVLTLARVVQGAGSAAGMVVGRALIQDLFAGAERTRMMALVGMTMGLVPPTGALVGGHLHVQFGWQANFVLLLVVALLLLAAAWRGLPSRPAAARPPDRKWREVFSGYGQLARQPQFKLFALMLAATTATFYTFLGGAPLVLKEYGVTPERIGWYIMSIPGAYIVGNFLTTRLVREVPEHKLMAAGQCGIFSGLVLLLLLGLAGLHTPLALALPLVLVGVGHGLLVPSTLSGTVGLVPALAGSAAAVAGLSQQMGGATGGMLAGLVPHRGPVNLALLMLAWSTLALAAQLVLLRRFPRRG